VVEDKTAVKEKEAVVETKPEGKKEEKAGDVQTKKETAPPEEEKK